MEAYRAVQSTHPRDMQFPTLRYDEQGLIEIWLERQTIEALNRATAPHETLSNVIVRTVREGRWADACAGFEAKSRRREGKDMSGGGMIEGDGSNYGRREAAAGRWDPDAHDALMEIVDALCEALAAAPLAGGEETLKTIRSIADRARILRNRTLGIG